MKLTTLPEKDAARAQRAVDQAGDYTVEILNPILGLCAVTHKQDPQRDYRVTGKGCSCRDFARNGGLTPCKHMRIRAAYLTAAAPVAAAPAAPVADPVPFEQFVAEECGSRAAVRYSANDRSLLAEIDRAARPAPKRELVRRRMAHDFPTF